MATTCAQRWAVLLVFTLTLTTHYTEGITSEELAGVLRFRTVRFTSSHTFVGERALIDRFNAEEASRGNTSMSPTDPHTLRLFVEALPLALGPTSDPSAHMDAVLTPARGDDVVQDASGWLQSKHLSSTFLTNVTDLWTDLGLDNAGRPSSFFADACRGEDGAYYALPFVGSARVLYYDARRPLPGTLPDSLEGMEAFCDAHMESPLGQEEGSGCIFFWTHVLPAHTQLAVFVDMMILSEHGSAFLKSLQTGNEISFDDPQVVQSWERISRMISKGHFAASRYLDDFEAGRTKFLVASLGAQPLFRPPFTRTNSTLGDALTPFTLPAARAQGVSTRLMATVGRLLIPSGSSKKIQASRFVRYLMGNETFEARLRESSISWPITQEGSPFQGINPVFDEVSAILEETEQLGFPSDVMFSSIPMRNAWTQASHMVLEGTPVSKIILMLEATRLAEYEGQVSKPLTSLTPGLYRNVVNFTLSCDTPGARIYYTLDGSVPFSGSLEADASHPIILVETSQVTIRAIGLRDDLRDSELLNAVYTLDIPSPTSSSGSAGGADSSGALQFDTNASWSTTAIVIVVLLALASCCALALLVGYAWIKVRRKPATVYALADHPPILFSEISLGDSLGAGAYGAVYLGEWRSTPVAVKILWAHKPKAWAERSQQLGDARDGGRSLRSTSLSSLSVTSPHITINNVNNINNTNNTNNTNKTEFGNGGGGKGASTPSPPPPPPPPPPPVVPVVAASAFSSRDFTLSHKSKIDFLREAAILRSLRHPNIVTFMGICLHPPALVTEHMSRGSLDAYIHNSELEIEVSALLRWAYEIASGVAFLHESDMLHLDLKSHNVLISSTWTAKLCDFGVSKFRQAPESSSQENSSAENDLNKGSFTASLQVLSTISATSVTRNGTDGLEEGEEPLRSVVGTLFWNSPEALARKEELTSASDMYSLGVLLYELFSRRLPYSTQAKDGRYHHLNLYGIAGRIMSGTLRPDLKLLISETPALISSLLASMWTQTPEGRPSAKYVVSQLEPLTEMDTAAVVYPVIRDAVSQSEMFVLSVQLGHFPDMMLAFPTAVSSVTQAFVLGVESAISRVNGIVLNKSPFLVRLVLHTISELGRFLDSLDVCMREANVVWQVIQSLWPNSLRTPLAAEYTLPPCGALRVQVGVAFGVGDIAVDPETLLYQVSGTPIEVADACASQAYPGQVVVTDDTWRKIEGMASLFCGWECSLLERPGGAAISGPLRSMIMRRNGMHLVDLSSLFSATTDALISCRGLLPSTSMPNAYEWEEGERTASVVSAPAPQWERDWLVPAKQVKLFLDAATTSVIGSGSFATSYRGRLDGSGPGQHHVVYKMFHSQTWDPELAAAFAGQFGRLTLSAPMGLVHPISICIEYPHIGYFLPLAKYGSLKELIRAQAEGRGLGVSGSSGNSLSPRRASLAAPASLSTLTPGPPASPFFQLVQESHVVHAFITMASAVLTALDAGCAPFTISPYPNNFLIMSLDSVAGLSLALSDAGLSTPSNLTDSIIYDAPEILRDGTVNGPGTEAGLVYALAMTFYEVLTGREPFAGRSPLSASTLILDGIRPSMHSSILPSSSRAWPRLRDLIRRMWRNDPGGRPGLGGVVSELRDIASATSERTSGASA